MIRVVFLMGRKQQPQNVPVTRLTLYVELFLRSAGSRGNPTHTPMFPRGQICSAFFVHKVRGLAA
eukprot:6491487-Amphidinium_carterae.1